MYAIVDVGGKQYKAQVGKQLVVDRLDAAEGSVVELKAVLVKSGDELRLDQPSTVAARVVEHFKGPKVVVFKFKPKRGYKRKTGFRAALTRLAVEEIR